MTDTNDKISDKTKQLKDKLVRQPTRLWDRFSEQERTEAFSFCTRYMEFLNACRTERRAVKFFRERAAAEGFQDLSPETWPKKVLFVLRGKILALAITGLKPLSEGIRLVTSHVDCPRLDLKPNPLYEDTGLALLKTHYYGGIKKYQWVARGLALCGTVVLQDNSTVEVDIGVSPGDPVLTVPDLLPHLSRKQLEQKASEFIPAETLNVIAGGIPYEDKEAEDRVKLAVLEYLHAKYGMIEEDFLTAELQLVPAEQARDCGLDRSLVAGYGQDDRICAYTSFTALLETENPEHTAVAVFYDKEEIGSEGNSSAKSIFLELFLMDLMHASGMEPSTRNLHALLTKSRALSADVTAAIDPNFPEVHEKRNAAKLGYGIGLKRYTGHGGKYMASEANAEHAAWVRKLFNEH
ncbi:MAG TPA: aminopeptidase, partial [Desulfomonilaceae bacterium]|nr:aminopeptidase [Desulfomonilaceae bacterium]